MSIIRGSEEVQLGDTGNFLKDGILVDKNGEPVRKKCRNCPTGRCTCDGSTDSSGNDSVSVDAEEWHH